MGKKSDLYYFFIRKKNKLFSIPQNIKHYHQRGKRGWADIDAWDIDSHLVEVLPPMLRHVANKGISYPGRYPYDTHKKWKKALLIAADDIEAYSKLEEKRLPKDFGIDPNVTKQYHKDCKKAAERTTKGMKFIAKNFFDLWD